VVSGNGEKLYDNSKGLIVMGRIIFLNLYRKTREELYHLSPETLNLKKYRLCLKVFFHALREQAESTILSIKCNFCI
jgi:hypothetical protein